MLKPLQSNVAIKIICPMLIKIDSNREDLKILLTFSNDFNLATKSLFTESSI